MQAEFLTSYKKFIVAFVVLFFLLFIIITLSIPHREGDEVIYQTLGMKLANGQAYNLQETTILKFLPQHMYNTDFFFRPPAFMIYLAILYKLFGTVGLHVAPVLIYITLCIIIYKTVFLITKSQHTSLKALIISVLSTQFIFASTKIHLDLFLTLMVALSFFFLVFYKEKKNYWFACLAGLFLVLAVLTKYTALVLFPLFLLFLLMVDKRKPQSLVLFLLPSLVLIYWFYFIFSVIHMSTEALVSAPDKDMLARFPFVTYVHDRPFYFYFLNIFLINPFFVYFFLLCKKNMWHHLTKQYGYVVYFLITVILVLLLALTYMGIRGVSYQMRYILPAEPFLIILLSLIPFEKNKALQQISFLFIFYNLLLILYNFGKAEIYSFFEMILNKR